MNKTGEKIRLGKIVNTVGLKGEVRIYPYTDYKEKFEELPYLLVEENSYSINSVRYAKNMAVVKLSDINTKEAADELREKEVFILRADAPQLPSDTYYVKDLIGLRVQDDKNQLVGTIVEVVIGAAQDLYMVKTIDGEKIFPIPAVSRFVKDVNLKSGVITIELIEGLMEL